MRRNAAMLSMALGLLVLALSAYAGEVPERTPSPPAAGALLDAILSQDTVPLGEGTVPTPKPAQCGQCIRPRDCTRMPFCISICSSGCCDYMCSVAPPPSSQGSAASCAEDPLF